MLREITNGKMVMYRIIISRYTVGTALKRVIEVLSTYKVSTDTSNQNREGSQISLKFFKSRVVYAAF